MDKQKLLIIREDLSKNIPSADHVKELCEYLVGESRSYTGFNVQSVLLYLLDYYIEHEYSEE